MSGQQINCWIVGLCSALWLTPLVSVWAQDANPTVAQQAEAHEARAESERAMAEARAQAHEARTESERALAKARTQLREAARTVAEITRARFHEQGGPGSRGYSFSFSTEDNDKPRLGLVMGPASEPGVKILSVTPESPAQQAGLRSGDVVTSVNGTALDQAAPEQRLQQFFELLGELQADKAVTLAYRREGGEAQNISLTPEPLDDFSFMPFVPNVDVEAIIDGVSEAMPVIHIDGEDAPLRIRGLRSLRMLRDFELTALDPQLGAYFGSEQGLLVLGVPESLQEQLQRGDVLLQIDGREPKDVDHAFRILRSYEPGEAVSLSILRRKQREEISVTLPEVSDENIFFRRERMAPPAPPPPPEPMGNVPQRPVITRERMVIKT